MPTRLLLAAAALVGLALRIAASPVFDPMDYGAKGDGVSIDTPAIQAAIDAAAGAGGGTVHLPAGTYLSYSVRLRSHINLHLGPGATLLAADPPADGEPGYDPPEPNVWGDEHRYQDFGHSHWRNSLIWGIGLEKVSITGAGLIDGRGLVGARRFLRPAEREAESAGGDPGGIPARGRYRESRVGNGDKAIALKNCRNVTLRDISMFRAGHFALLATGVDNLTIDNLRVDTNRDGFDIDACRNVRVSNCLVNSPRDDAIVLKSSFALGEARATENVTITNCQVSGYAVGSLLDGTFERSLEPAPDRGGPTGRIKFGTESNGGFRNITISNCVFDHCRGLALEIVDGGQLEDVTISNLTMRDIVNAPLFLRLGNRARGPEGTPVGSLRRVHISNVIVHNADARYASQIVGLADHPIEDVTISNVRIVYRGGLTMAQVAEQPEDLVNPFFAPRAGPAGRGRSDPYAVPEQEAAYPEPSMFGLLPAYGLYVRHARGIRVHDVDFEFINEDRRPAVVLDEVTDIAFDRFEAQTAADTPMFVLRSVRDFSTHRVRGLDNLHRIEAANESLPASKNATRPSPGD